MPGFRLLWSLRHGLYLLETEAICEELFAGLDCLTSEALQSWRQAGYSCGLI